MSTATTALRNLAIPKFLPTMNNLEYVDFFHASSAGHYKLFVLALSKIGGGMRILSHASSKGGYQ